MGKNTKKRYLIILLITLIGFLFIAPSGLWAEKLTHKVQKGDTLWGICEKYYGDPELWPKLWQMNSFVTNPHLLKPGDLITLFEMEPVKVEKPEAPVEKEKPEPRAMGISMDGVADLTSLGFLSLDKIDPWGSLFASEGDKIILTAGDIAFVLFNEDKNIKTGDKFSIGSISPLLKHPVTGKDLGYTFEARGRIVVEEMLGLAHKDNKFYNKKNVFQIKLIETRDPVHIGDVLLPCEKVSSCIMPISMEGELLGNIVASKGDQVLIQPNSVVYIDLGTSDGVRKGNIFEILKGNIVPDPKPDKKIFPLWKSNIILPDTLLGKVIIVESRSDTSTGVVLTADQPISIGAYVKNLSWEEKPEFLSPVEGCPIE